MLITKHESVDLKNCDGPADSAEYSSDTWDAYKMIGEYNLETSKKLMIVFDYIIADIISNRELNPVVTDLLIRDKKLNILLLALRKLFFKLLKEII